MTQEELADTAGLSTVHVNRSLQALRAEGLVDLKNKRVVIVDHERLIEYSGFNPNYLHLGQRAGAGSEHLASEQAELEE